MAKNEQLNLIVIVKMLNIGFINKYVINLEIRGDYVNQNQIKFWFEIRGGYVVLVNYQSLVLKFFPLAPPFIFLYKI